MKRNQRLEFSTVGYRIESVTYETAAKVMGRMGCGDTEFKVLLNQGFSLIIFPMINPTLYFAVTEEQMKQIAQDIGPEKRGLSVLGADRKKEKEEREDMILGLKLGSSQAIALTEDAARSILLAKIAQHNSGS